MGLKMALFVGLMMSLTSMLLQAVEYVPRGTADIERTAEERQMFEYSGVDAEYQHGRHCVDSRGF